MGAFTNSNHGQEPRKAQVIRSQTPPNRSPTAPEVASAIELADSEMPEMVAARAMVNHTGVLRDLDGVITVGIWSDLDGVKIRAALQIPGHDGVPIRYPDGPRIPPGYKLRTVPGEPVSLNVLAEMERHRAEPWKIRDRMLREMGWGMSSEIEFGFGGSE